MKPMPDAILAPQQGISRDNQGNAVALVVDGDSRVEKRMVTTERTIRNQWLISSGLQAGDRLIVEGTSKVSAGMSVRTVAATVNQEGAILLGVSGQAAGGHNADLASE